LHKPNKSFVLMKEKKLHGWITNKSNSQNTPRSIFGKPKNSWFLCSITICKMFYHLGLFMIPFLAFPHIYAISVLEFQNTLSTYFHFISHSRVKTKWNIQTITFTIYC
jgi:hypothetical protein